ncbi:unnamed protein product, partial [Symbiodinium sp. KB8]
QEAGLKAEIERLQVDHEASEQCAEEERLRASSFSEQLSVAKAREEELLKQELAKTKEFRTNLCPDHLTIQGVIRVLSTAHGTAAG